MSSGGIGYALYIGSLWCLAEGGPDGFVIASGAILGTTAALLCKSQYIFHQVKVNELWKSKSKSRADPRGIPRGSSHVLPTRIRTSNNIRHAVVIT
jgi:hypothetical protein